MNSITTSSLDEHVKDCGDDSPLKTSKAKRRRIYTPFLWTSEIATTSTEDPVTYPAPHTICEPILNADNNSSTKAEEPVSLETPVVLSSVRDDSDEMMNDETCPAVDQSSLNTSQEDIDTAFSFGSEDDSDGESDEGEECGDFPVLVPRKERMFLDVARDQAPDEAPERDPGDEPALPQFEPRDMFHFDWRPLPDTSVAPIERREVFADINCGPTSEFLTPYDAFIAIWDRDFMTNIAEETNTYAQELLKKLAKDGSLKPSSRINLWKPTDADELYVYFGLLLATGVCIKSAIKEYWSKEDVLATPNFCVYMSLNRYLLLSRCLHFASNSSQLHSLSRAQAKLYKIDPVLKHLNSRFQSLYRLSRNIALDESLTMWKWWLDIKQINKNKAASVGIKTYEICDSQTGYLWRFKVHAGREEGAERKVTPFSDGVGAFVLELLKGLEYRGHTVWMDNYYNSPALARVLKSLGFDCVGTLQTSRRYVPRELSTLNKHDMLPGQVASSTSGDVDVLVWRDQNRVALLSTYHGNAVCTINEKPRPIAVYDYNLCMGGVDKKDQILSTYPIERTRSKIWYKKLFRRLLNVSVLNAYILYKNCSKDKQRVNSKHRDFRRDLVKQLLQRHKVRPTTDISGTMKTSVVQSRKIATSVPVLSEEVLKHFPAEYGFISGSNREKKRRCCVVCHKRVHTYCPGCDVALCAFQCIKTYHQ